MDPPETVDHVRQRVASAIVQTIGLPHLSEITPEMWAQVPAELVDNVVARYATSYGVDPLVKVFLHGMCIF